MFPKIKKENLSRKILKALQEYIIRNNLGSGDRLPTEMEMARQFNVGRNAVREALKALELIGLITSKPGTGTVLSQGGLDPYLLPFLFGLILRDVGMDPLDDLSKVIWLGVTAAVVRRATEKELESLLAQADEIDLMRKNLFARIDRTRDTVSEEYEICHKESRFDRRLVELSHNSILMKFYAVWEAVSVPGAMKTEDRNAADRTGSRREAETVSLRTIAEALARRDEAEAACLNQKRLCNRAARPSGVGREILIRLLHQNGVSDGVFGLDSKS